MKLNEKYEILTDEGWCDFRGVDKSENRNLYRVTLENETITVTNDHQFFKNGFCYSLEDLKIGDYIDVISKKSKILNIEYVGENTVYTPIEVKNKKHSYVSNSTIINKQCDELAFLPRNIQTGFWASVHPTLSEGEKCIVTSTPNNEDDKFAQLWNGANKIEDEYGNINSDGVGNNGFKAYKAYWWQNPERDEKWEREMRGTLGDITFERECNLKFITAEETLIDSLTLQTLKGKEPSYFTGKVRWYDDLLPNFWYLVALDPSTGTGGDYSAIQVFRVPDFKQIAEWKHNKTDVRGQLKTLYNILTYIDEHLYNMPEQDGEPEIYWSIENNGIGEAALLSIEDIGEENFPGTFIHEPKKSYRSTLRKGMNTTERKKLLACTKLKSYVESNRISICSIPLISELKNFISKGSSFEAKRGAHDDLVDAVLLILRILEVIRDWDDEIEEELRETLSDDNTDENDEPMPTIIV